MIAVKSCPSVFPDPGSADSQPNRRRRAGAPLRRSKHSKGLSYARPKTTIATVLTAIICRAPIIDHAQLATSWIGSLYCNNHPLQPPHANWLEFSPNIESPAAPRVRRVPSPSRRQRLARARAAGLSTLTPYDAWRWSHSIHHAKSVTTRAAAHLDQQFPQLDVAKSRWQDACACHRQRQRADRRGSHARLYCSSVSGHLCLARRRS
jgi:hypothetical protein